MCACVYLPQHVCGDLRINCESQNLWCAERNSSVHFNQVIVPWEVIVYRCVYSLSTVCFSPSYLGMWPTSFSCYFCYSCNLACYTSTLTRNTYFSFTPPPPNLFYKFYFWFRTESFHPKSWEAPIISEEGVRKAGTGNWECSAVSRFPPLLLSRG